MLNRLSRPALALTATGLAAVMLTACGDDNAPEVSAPTDTTTQEAPSTPTPETTPSPETSSAAPETSTSAPETSTTEPSTPTSVAPPTKATKPPAKGKNVVLGNKKKFQITLPKGWQDLSDKFADSKIIELAIGAGAPSNGKLTNINVASVKLPISDTKQAAQQSADKYKKQGDVVKMLPQRQVAGETTNGYEKHDKKKTQSQTQLFFAHDGNVYIITLTNSPKSASEANKALDDFITSWTWR